MWVLAPYSTAGVDVGVVPTRPPITLPIQDNLLQAGSRAPALRVEKVSVGYIQARTVATYILLGSESSLGTSRNLHRLVGLDVSGPSNDLRQSPQPVIHYAYLTGSEGNEGSNSGMKIISVRAPHYP